MKNSTKLINRIKSEGVQPIPKWQFVSKQWFVWSIFVMSLVFGALAFSVILYSIQQTDFVLLSHLTHSKIEFLLGLLPFFWLFGLLLFLVFSIYAIQYSKKAYKLTLAKLVGWSAAMSILLGTMFFIGGGACKLEEAFASNLSIYQGLEQHKVKIWNNPEEGLLSGVIVTVGSEQFELKDLRNKIWTIKYPDAWIAPIVNLENDARIKLIGKKIDEQLFIAKEIRPWGGQGMHHKMKE